MSMQPNFAAASAIACTEAASATSARTAVAFSPTGTTAFGGYDTRAGLREHADALMRLEAFAA